MTFIPAKQFYNVGLHNKIGQFRFGKIPLILIIALAICIFSILLYLSYKPRTKVCGNNICEYFETPSNCCIDCGCYPGEICNKKLNRCEEKPFELSDERVKELIENYYKSVGKKVSSIEITHIVNIDEKIGRRCIVSFEDESWMSVIVTEDEKIIEEEPL